MSSRRQDTSIKPGKICISIFGIILVCKNFNAPASVCSDIKKPFKPRFNIYLIEINKRVSEVYSTCISALLVEMVIYICLFCNSLNFSNCINYLESVYYKILIGVCNLL